MIIEYAYAKINIALEVKEKRNDGFHEVTNVMLPIDLYDVLTFEKSDELILESNLEIENNFILTAAKLFFKTYNIEGGAKITLEKNIPIQAGLAGGSADASACLRGLNRLYNTFISLDELASLASSLGSDMPYCIYQKLSKCSGRGEIVEVKDIDYYKYNVLLIKPSFGLSTKEVYQNYTYEYKDRTKQIDNIFTALMTNNLDLLNTNIFNDLESSTKKLSLEVKDILNKFSDIKMSGSGPTLYIISKGEKINEIKEMFDDSFLILQTKFL